MPDHAIGAFFREMRNSLCMKLSRNSSVDPIYCTACPLKCCPTLLLYYTVNLCLIDQCKTNATERLCVSAFNRKNRSNIPTKLNISQHFKCKRVILGPNFQYTVRHAVKNYKI